MQDDHHSYKSCYQHIKVLHKMPDIYRWVKMFKTFCAVTYWIDTIKLKIKF